MNMAGVLRVLSGTRAAPETSGLAGEERGVYGRNLWGLPASWAPGPTTLHPHIVSEASCHQDQTSLKRWNALASGKLHQSHTACRALCSLCPGAVPRETRKATSQYLGA